MGYYKICGLIAVVQVGLILAYVHHQSTLSHLYYQYQKAEQKYHDLIRKRDQKAQQIQRDHTYARILETAKYNGMQSVPLKNVRRVKQDTS